MRLLVNHSDDDRPYLGALIPMMKERGLTGVSTTRAFDITTLQAAAQKASADAILLSNPETLKQLLGEKASLDAYRGTRINYTVPAIVINPLAHIHVLDYGRWLLEQDLAKFRYIKWPVQTFDFILVESEELRAEALAFLKRCFLISFDIETDNKRQITCISFTGLQESGSVQTFVVPLVDFDELHYTDLEEFQDALLFIREVQALPAFKAAYNGSYDSQYCISYHAAPNAFTLDAMILGWSLYSELPRGLEFNASIHCYDYFYWKDEADLAKSKKDIRSFWAYCGKDSWYTLRVLLSQLKGLQAYQVFNYQETFKLVYPALYCAFEGLKVNSDKLKEVRADRERELEDKKRKLKTISCNPNFNPGSWQQVSQLIYDVIGGKRPEKVKGAGTSAAALNRVAVQHPLLAIVCDLITKSREDAKAISQYCDFDQLFGRMLYNLDVSGTETGRLACKASSFWVGAQIQNVPDYAKVYLEADPGYVLLEPDKNKSEARCVAYLSQAPKMIAALEDTERDFYKICASMFFGMPYEEVSKELRNDVTKHVIHGIHYVMGPEPLIDRVTPKKMYEAITLTKSKLRNLTTFAKYLLSLYKHMNPELATVFYPAIKTEIAGTHMLRSSLGWTRYFFGNPLKQHNVFRAAVAHAPQNLSVHAMNKAMWRVYTELVLPSNGDFRLKAQIHDSLLVQVKEERAEEYMTKMRELMRVPITIHGRELIIPTDFKMGKVWGEMKEVKP